MPSGCAGGGSGAASTVREWTRPVRRPDAGWVPGRGSRRAAECWGNDTPPKPGSQKSFLCSSCYTHARAFPHSHYDTQRLWSPWLAQEGLSRTGFHRRSTLLRHRSTWLCKSSSSIGLPEMSSHRWSRLKSATEVTTGRRGWGVSTGGGETTRAMPKTTKRSTATEVEGWRRPGPQASAQTATS